MNAPPRLTLDRVPLGVRCRIVEAPVYGIRFQELGMIPGREVEVLRRGWWGGALVVRVRGARLCIRAREAVRFTVESA